jgi:hypothetical protein
VWVTVVPERVTATTEVRGRLMGPRCPYSSTVEVAYPLRPLPQPLPTTEANLTRRVVIPEASLWEPESPFVYEGPIELWQDGQCCDRQVVRHGLRTFSLGPRGLRVNGKVLPLRGRVAGRWSEDQVRARRMAGDNVIVAPLEPDEASCWDAADRLGMLVLGRVSRADEWTERQLSELSRHPCHLGFLIDQGLWRQTGQSIVDWMLAHGGTSMIGAELDETPPWPLPQGIHFLVCPDVRSADRAGGEVPLLLMGGPSPPSSGGTILGVLSTTAS